LSRRVVLDQNNYNDSVDNDSVEKPPSIKHNFSLAEDNWWDKLWGYVCSWMSPEAFTDENRKTIKCFKKYLLDRVGKSRLKRICQSASVDLDKLETNGMPLTTRDVEKIIVLLKDVTVEDIQELIEAAKK